MGREFQNKSLKISKNSKVLHDRYIHVFIALRLQLLQIITRHLSFECAETVKRTAAVRSG